MEKGKKIALGFVGIGLLYYSFKNKSTTETNADTGTENILNSFDNEILFSARQIQVAISDLKEVSNDPIQINYLRAWRGLIQIDVEGQLAEKNLLTFSKMQTIQIELTGIFRQTVKTGKRLISDYCKKNNYLVSDRIYTIESNLVNISKDLYK